tara:strand:+ start:5497 stop:5727 length:231 start_codon:yes stop_codon:yes gene_type:complete
MAKITLDDIEYDTEDFSDEQNNMLAEIQFNASVQRQSEYYLSSLKIVSAEVIRRLKETLVEETLVETSEDENKEDA